MYILHPCDVSILRVALTSGSVTGTRSLRLKRHDLIEKVRRIPTGTSDSSNVSGRYPEEPCMSNANNGSISLTIVYPIWSVCELRCIPLL